MRLILVSLITMLLATNTYGTTGSPSPTPEPATSPEPKVTCLDVIKACDKALKKKDEELKLSDLAIKKLQDDNAGLNTELMKEKDSNSSLWKNPFFWTGIGLVLGGTVMGLTK